MMYDLINPESRIQDTPIKQRFALLQYWPLLVVLFCIWGAQYY